MFGTQQQQLNEWRWTHCQRENYWALKVLFNDVWDYAYIAILSWGRFFELRPIYHGCRALTFALATLSCSCLRHLWRHSVSGTSVHCLLTARDSLWLRARPA